MKKEYIPKLIFELTGSSVHIIASLQKLPIQERRTFAHDNSVPEIVLQKVDTIASPSTYLLLIIHSTVNLKETDFSALNRHFLKAAFRIQFRLQLRDFVS